MSKGATQVQETPAQKALAQHAQLVMQDYQQRWLPVQRSLASQIEQMGAPGSQLRREAAGKASTDTAMTFSAAGDKLAAGLSDHGAAPGSGRFDMAVTGLGGDAAKSSGIGQMISDQQITDAYTSGLQALTAIGQGQSAMVGQSMEQQAQSSSMQAEADASAALQDRMATGGAIGTAIGLAGQQFLKPSGFSPNVNGITAGTSYANTPVNQGPNGGDPNGSYWGIE